MIEEIRKILQLAEGNQCWHASVGGCTLPTFNLVLGEAIKRTVPIGNSSQPPLFQTHRGRYEFLIWCTWRLEQTDHVIVSSDGKDSDIVLGIERLVGLTLTSVGVKAPAWDLDMEFSDGYKLVVFCDHTESDPSVDGNWDALIDNIIIYAGPGTKIKQGLWKW